ncbi:DUF3626 domain-containing protein [Cohnella nanjingensis]|uniref:DUF3626 domain-containing protein n=1 Tax=Cohnella nanjingensis TaxID=1387779 RepID=A0A7X0RTM9_9BACL|nr:DUF3626 domain-containing protein [Cohnella nanjingensis]MBB6673333.1 DUF3626 domain-containing protein [Cohnella nanjingensis]
MHALTRAQAQALQHVREAAWPHRQRAQEILEDILSRAGVLKDEGMAILSRIGRRARVTLNFHPDRVLPDGITVVEGLLLAGKYRSQFETRVTNGSRTAYPGGDRDRWEELLFGGAYQASDAREDARPKYGALNLMRHADGAAPRFGSCYLILRPEVSGRCTFTLGDSHLGPEHVGTSDVLAPLLAALLRQIETDHAALGVAPLDPGAFLNRLRQAEAVASVPGSGLVGRALDDYVEAQVHGEIDLSADVEALVADPSYRGTQIGGRLRDLCARHGLGLYWHAGFRLETARVPDDFRGPAMPPLARRVDRGFAATPGLLDAAAIGRAAASARHEPELWRDWASPEETFQHFKQLWHVLVRFGR